MAQQSQSAHSVTLASPEVQAAKKRFNEVNTMRKISLSFEKLFEIFSKDDMRFACIARELGVSRQAVHHIYNAHFRALFGERTGRQRWKGNTAQARLELRIKVSLSRPSLAVVVAEAEKYGCDVSLATCERDGIVEPRRPTILLIDGCPCSVRTTITSMKPAKGHVRPYGRVSLSLESLKTTVDTIVHTNVAGFQERFFIVPNQVLIDAFFVGRSRKSKQHSATIPLERPKKPRRGLKVDWWRYENAWG